MRSRIVRLAVMAAAAALVLFGVPLAIGLDQFTTAEERASIQRLADFTARAVQDDMTHDRIPSELPTGVGNAAVSLYDAEGDLLLGNGPPKADEQVDRVLRRNLSELPQQDLVVATPVTDSDDVIGAVRVALPPETTAALLFPLWLAMASLAVLILVAVWLLARRLAQRLSRPMERLASEAARLGEGDFGIAPNPTGIREVDLVGQTLADTAERLDDLLARERAFSAEASHQLRTPLAGLRLRLESTLDRPDRLTRETIEDGIASIDRLERTIEELLELAREHQTRSAPVDLEQLLREAEQEWHERLARDGRAFTVSRPADLPDPNAGTAAVRQIVGVLLDNAAQHGAGTVALIAREAGPGVVALDVTDEGPGMPDRAFSDDADHSGMGVALARRLAESEGCRLTIQREPSVASLLLPTIDTRRPIQQISS